MCECFWGSPPRHIYCGILAVVRAGLGWLIYAAVSAELVGLLA